MTPQDLLTHDIIKKCLLKDKGSNAEILTWSLENSSELGGVFNVTERIIVSFLEEGVEKKTSYVAKLNPRKPKDLFNPYRQRAVMKEVFFYTQLLPLLNEELEAVKEPPLKVPRFLFSSLEKEKEIIIFEDLSRLGYELLGRSAKLDAAHCELMAKELARLHLASFLLKRNYSSCLSEEFPLLVESWMVDGEPELSLGFSKLFSKGIKCNIDVVAALKDYDDHLPSLQALANHGGAIDILKKHLESTSEWNFICHGDYHRSNVLFRYDEEKRPLEMMVLDWQTVRVASIGSEFSYLAFSSFINPDREALMQLIHRKYFDYFSNAINTEEMPFTLNSLEKCTSENHFGLLICFYLIPMFLCVSDRSMVFSIDEEKEHNKENTIDIVKGENYLKKNGFLKVILSDYLYEIGKRRLNYIFECGHYTQYN